MRHCCLQRWMHGTSGAEGVVLDGRDGQGKTTAITAAGWLLWEQAAAEAVVVEARERCGWTAACAVLRTGD